MKDYTDVASADLFQEAVKLEREQRDLFEELCVITRSYRVVRKLGALSPGIEQVISAVRNALTDRRAALGDIVKQMDWRMRKAQVDVVFSPSSPFCFANFRPGSALAECCDIVDLDRRLTGTDSAFDAQLEPSIPTEEKK